MLNSGLVSQRFLHSLTRDCARNLRWSRPRQSVQIVQSVRIGDKVKQKIVRYVGIAMYDDELAQLKVLAEVYRQLSFDTLLPQKRYRASHEALFHCVMARIANPPPEQDKRGSVQHLEQDSCVSLPLEKVYRMMDQLDDNAISRLQAMTCEGTRSLLPGALDVLFFDCTTLYFESFKEDELKQNGYSKDCQVNQTQVNQPQVFLALLVTHEGLPVGYEVFPGATFEGHSLISVLKELQARYDVRKMIFVADRGMLNEDNLHALDEAGAYYIVGAKLKQLPVALQAKVLDKSAYQALGKGASSVAELTHKKRRLIKKIGKSQNPKRLLNNYGYKKFLIIKGKTSLSINQDKIDAESRWDGNLCCDGIKSDHHSLPTVLIDIILQYLGICSAYVFLRSFINQLVMSADRRSQVRFRTV